MCLLIFKEREREKNRCERNNQLVVPACVLNGDQTYNLGTYVP